MMGRGEDERCRPRPPVRMSRKSVRDASGVCMVRMRGERVARRGCGRRESRRMGRMERNARIWWAELKEDD